MYNSLLHKDVQAMLTAAESMADQLSRMKENGTWMDCSETNEEEISHMEHLLRETQRWIRHLDSIFIR